ncbi:MAG: guanylate kinase [Fimbriimonadia bacterium]|nr:guanylate kinase [Fimbriimonadia bacterium]
MANGTDNNQTERGLLIVFSGPAGAGKDTLLDKWMESVPSVRRLVTYTTRAAASSEKHGIDYFFVSEEEFKEMIEESAFLEYAQVHGNWYGTPLRDIEKMRDNGRDVVLKIDVQGAAQVIEKLKDAIMIFIQAPSITELATRLRKRGRDTEEDIQLRLANAEKEMEYIPLYHYLVTNDDVGRAVETLRCIRIAEKHRIR